LLAKNIESNIFLGLISRYITKSSPAVVQMIMNTLTVSFSKANKDHLLYILPQFVDCLFFSMNHKVTEIRKLAVFCIVELFVMIGPEFEPYLNQLNTAQRNLVSIYINKRTKKI
jgi:CLIP-associating protein 1/2